MPAVIATKVGMECIDPTGGPGGAPWVRPNGRPEQVRTTIDTGLRRLGTDLYQLHRVDPEVPIHRVTTVQSEFSLWTRDVQAEVLSYCKDHGIGLLPYSPLGRGLLLGRFSSFDELPESDQRRRLPRFQQDNLRANLDIAAKVREHQDTHLPRRQRGRRRRTAARGRPRRPRRHPGARY